MMHRSGIIYSLTVCLSLLCLLTAGMTAGARTIVREDLPAVIMTADSVAVEVADTSDVYADSLLNQMFSQKRDTVVVVLDRGYDAGRYVNIRRQRAVDVTPFTNKPFWANTFVSVSTKMNKMLSEDYSYGLMGVASIGKWLHEDHAIRLEAGVGSYQDNFDGAPIRNIELGASYLFNLTSYVSGYRTNRLCEVMIVSGLGLTGTSHEHKFTPAVNAHVGANVNLRLFKDFSLFVEPTAAIYTNGVAVSYGGNWRTWLSSYQTKLGLTYNIATSKSPDSPRLLPRTEGWFISLYGGPHFQNSELVHNYAGLDSSLGIHMALGIGKYYTDFFSFRFSGAYSRGPWVIYGPQKKMPCNYFALRTEALLDLYGLIARNKENKFALSLVFGPEVGYMYKKDHQLMDNSLDLIIRTVYAGVCGGVQVKTRLTERLALFLEPRFSIVPYAAPYYDQISINDYRNYYDGIVNCNFGIEFML